MSDLGLTHVLQARQDEHRAGPLGKLLEGHAHEVQGLASLEHLLGAVILRRVQGLVIGLVPARAAGGGPAVQVGGDMGGGGEDVGVGLATSAESPSRRARRTNTSCTASSSSGGRMPLRWK